MYDLKQKLTSLTSGMIDGIPLKNFNLGAAGIQFEAVVTDRRSQIFVDSSSDLLLDRSR